MFRVAVISFIIAFCANVHGLTLEECQVFDFQYFCYSNFETKYFAARSKVQTCLAISSYIGCIETGGCDCNMTSDYDLHVTVALFTDFYEDQKCHEEETLGYLPEKYGFPCEKWNTTSNSTHGELINLEYAAGEFIINLDKNCTGIKSCYEAYDSEGALALHNRNISEYCFVLNDLVTCLDDAACACNGENSTDVMYQIVGEDYYYRQTCADINIKGHEMVPRLDIRCHANGTAAPRSNCDTPDPTYKCYLQYETTLFELGDSFEVLCPATEKYIKCVEEIACQCGLVKESSTYYTLSSAINYYNTSGCHRFSAPLDVIPGINCPDGTGTGNMDRIQLDLASHPTVELYEKWCSGVKKCHLDLEADAGVALFEKNQQKLCSHNKVFVECMELTLCECGVYDYRNSSFLLENLRDDHGYSCDEAVSLRDNYRCEYGQIGFKCKDNSDCLVVAQSECTEKKECGCKTDTKYIPLNMTCTAVQVSSANSPDSCKGGYLLGYGVLLVIMSLLRG